MIKAIYRFNSLILLIIAISCKGNIDVEPLNARSRNSIVVPSITLSADRPLYVSAPSTLGLFTHSWTPYIESGAGQFDGAGVIAVGAGVANSASVGAIDTTQSISPTGTIPTFIKAPSAVNFNISATSLLTDWSCSLPGPLSSYSCAEGGFSLTADQLANVFSLSTLWTHNSSATTNSSSLAVSRIVVRQVTNTSNSTLTDNALFLTKMNNDIYFVAWNQTDINKLFKINHADQTVSQVSRMRLHTNGNAPIQAVYNNKLFFWAENDTDNNQATRGYAKLYSYDGVNSIVQISDLSNSTTREDVDKAGNSTKEIGGKLYFLGYDGFTDLKNHVYTYDGTTIDKITDVQSSSNNDVNINSPYLFNYNNTLIFITQNPDNHLYQYNPSGPSLTWRTAFPIRADFGINWGPIHGPVNGKYFVIGTATNNLISTSDFVSFQTLPNSANSNFSMSYEFPELTPAYGNWLYFMNGTCNRTDGTIVQQFLDSSFTVCRMYPYGSDLYILGSKGAVDKLYKYDGTTFQQISNTSENQAITDEIVVLGYFDSEVYFLAKNSSGFKKLYKYDGTRVLQLTNTNPTGHDWPGFLVNVGDYIYFSSLDANSARRVYRLCVKVKPGCLD